MVRRSWKKEGQVEGYSLAAIAVMHWASLFLINGGRELLLLESEGGDCDSDVAMDVVDFIVVVVVVPNLNKVALSVLIAVGGRREVSPYRVTMSWWRACKHQNFTSTKGQDSSLERQTLRNSGLH
jgi:hypothetical protein